MNGKSLYNVVIVLMIIGLLIVAAYFLLLPRDRVIKEDDSKATNLTYTRYCLNGFSVLKVTGGESVATTSTGFMYELNGVGEPTRCK